MWPPTPIYERVPMVWILLGLLFNATGLYLGFEYSLSFWYLIIGWFCCAYGVAIFVFRLGMRPKGAADTRLSPAFISGAPTPAAPAMPNNDQVPAMGQSGTE